MERSITAAGLGPKEVLLIKSYLGLLPGKTRDIWIYRDEGPADVEIVPAGDSGAGMSRLRIEYGAGNGQGPRLQPPIRVTGMIAALDEASARLAQPSAAAPEATPAAVAGSTLAELLRARVPMQRRMLLGDGETWIEADFEQRRYRSSRPLQAVHASKNDWSLSDTAPVELSLQGPLTYLQWLAGVAEARVQPGHYRLLRWPDFGQLPHRPSFLKLAAFFARTGGSPAAAAHAALVPEPDVAAFLGGCVMAGYVMRMGEDKVRLREASPVTADYEGFRSLLARVRRRLGL